MPNIQTNLYAPGIATYGTKGAVGAKGNSGYSIYFIPYNLDRDEDKKDTIDNYISKNRSFSNNYLNTDGIYLSDRTYQFGDIFLTPDGKVYKYYEHKNIISLYEIGNMSKSDIDFFRIIENSEMIQLEDDKQLVIKDSSDVSINSNSLALLNIYSSNNKPYISLYNNVNNALLTVSSDVSNNVKFDTNNNIYINNLYVTNSDSINSKHGDYYKVLTNKDYDVSINDNKDIKQRTVIVSGDYIYTKYDIPTDNTTLNISMNQINGEPSTIDISDNIQMITVSSCNSYVSRIIYQKGDDISKLIIKKGTTNNEQN